MVKLPIKTFKKRHLKIKNRTVSYLQSGKGQTILFIHGMGTGTEIWKYVAPSIMDKYKVILLDLPGYILNKDFKVQNNFESLEKFIYDFIEIKGSIKYLVSYCLSGVITLELAHRPPRSLKKIIFLSTPIFTNSPVNIIRYAFKLIGSGTLRTKIIMFLITRFPIKHLIFLTKNLASVTNPKAMNECMRMFSNNSKQAEVFLNTAVIFSPTKFSRIKIPVEFICGEKDGFATVVMAKKALEFCHTGKINIVKDVYHLMPLEEPVKLASLIEKAFNPDKILV